jgi:hypothetical protein
VHLLAANGAKLPVKLKMQARENAATGKVAHVVQVSVIGTQVLSGLAASGAQTVACRPFSLLHRGTPPQLQLQP